MFCTECGMRLEQGSQFCKGCGTKAESLEQSSSSAETQKEASIEKGSTGLRGNILQYDPSTGTGLIVVAGAQHSFALSSWSGSLAPAVNQAILFDSSQNKVSPVSDEVLRQESNQLMKENLTRVGDQLGDTSKVFADNVMNVIGKDALIAYGCYIVAAIWLNFAKVNFFVNIGGSLYDLLKVVDTGISSNYRLLLYISFLSFLLPVVWKKDDRAWWSFFAPLAMTVGVVLVSYLKIQEAVDATQQSFGQLQGMFGGQAQKAPTISFWSVINFGMGFYVAVLSSAYLAWFGYREFLIRSRTRATR